MKHLSFGFYTALLQIFNFLILQSLFTAGDFSPQPLIKLLTFISETWACIQTAIITRWDTAQPGWWITALLSNEELVVLDLYFFRPLNHGKCRGNARMDSKNEHAECFGHGDGLFYDSWRGSEQYSRSGSPTNGPGVHSSAPSPEERLDLETVFSPGGSFSPLYWQGTTSDWMSAMSLIRRFPLKLHVFWSEKIEWK